MAWPAGGSAGIQNNVNTPRVLATDDVKWTGEGVAAVVAETEAQAYDAIEAITVDWEPLPTVVDAEKATEPRRPAAPRERPEQHRVRVDGRRQGGHGRRHRWRRGRRPPAHRQPAPHPELDRDARRYRLVQPGHRRVHRLDVEPDAAHPAAAADRLRDRDPRAQGPRASPGHRRRLRLEDLLLRRHGPDDVRQQGDRRPPGQVGRRPSRELPEHDPRSRPHHPPRDRRHEGRRDHRPSGQDPGQPRRPAVHDRPRHPDDALRARPGGLLQDPERLRRGHRRLHEHHVRRRVSRAPVARRRPTSSSGRWTCSRPRSGWTAPSSAAATSSSPTSSPTRTRPACTRPPAARRSRSTPATTSRRWTWRSRRSATRTSPRRRPRPRARGKLLGLGLSTYIEVCGVAPSKWIGAVGEGWGAAMWESSNIKVHLTGKVVVTVGTSPQGQGHETTYAQVIASELGIPMEDVIIQHSDTQGTPVRLRHVRQPDVVGRHDGRHQGRGQDPGQGPPLRRAHARGVPRRHRDRGRRIPGQGLARPQEDVPGDRLRARPRVRCAGGHGAVSRRDGLLRHAELHLAVRHAHRRRRDRRGDRHGRARPLRGGR